MHPYHITAMQNHAEALEALGADLLMIPEIAPTGGEMIKQAEILEEFAFEESIYGRFRTLRETFVHDTFARDLRRHSLRLLHDAALWKVRAAAKMKVKALERQMVTKAGNQAEFCRQLSHVKAFIRDLEIYAKDFDPDQPRVPAGSPDGGQWTSGGGDGSNAQDQATIDAENGIDESYGADAAIGLLGATALAVSDGVGAVLDGLGSLGEDGGAAATEDGDISLSDNAISHIFRDDEGHILDTPENRQLLTDVANDPLTTLGPDEWGNIWSERTLPDGSQVWTRVSNGQITNGGINTIPRTYDPKTGLSSPVKPGWKGIKYDYTDNRTGLQSNVSLFGKHLLPGRV